MDTPRFPMCSIGARRMGVVAQASKNGSSSQYDYDLIIIGCGVGGHGAALHAVEQGLKVSECGSSSMDA